MSSATSGGEQQMLAIARGLMTCPELLIIDELSLGLAPVVVHQLFATLKTLKEAGLTILLVEQNVHLAFAVSDQAYVIAEGRVVSDGPPAALAALPQIRRLSRPLTGCQSQLFGSRTPSHTASVKLRSHATALSCPQISRKRTPCGNLADNF
jgi:ABC-type polar amino acid transport system ATPase subunit